MTTVFGAIEIPRNTPPHEVVKTMVNLGLDHGQGVFSVFNSLLPQLLDLGYPHAWCTSMIEYTWVEQTCLRAGNKVYEITEALAEKLLYTELRGIGQQELKLPFAGIKIYLPPIARQKIFAHLKSPAWIYVARSDSNILKGNTLVHGASLHSVARGHNSVSTSYVSLCKEKDLSEIKKELPANEMATYLTVTPEYHGSDDKDVETAGQWLANVILYITSKEHRAVATNREYLALTERIGKLPPGSKKEKLKERRRSLDPDYRIIVGQDVAPLGSSREGGSLTVRTLVSGHWRNQITGRRLDDLGAPIPAKDRPHVRMWIEPFWRGPELAEATNPIREARG